MSHLTSPKLVQTNISTNLIITNTSALLTSPHLILNNTYPHLISPDFHVKVPSEKNLSKAVFIKVIEDVADVMVSGDGE